MTDIDTLIIGAGVIGLALAREMARAGHEVIVLERHSAIGTEISARNSEVIHAGLYYPQDSLKAALCVRGRALLYDYLETRHLPHKRCGKFIVATSETERDELAAIAIKARANGVTDVTELSAAQATAAEPALACVAALHSPSTGIIDAHAFMLSLQGAIEDHGGTIALNAPVTHVEVMKDGFAVHVGGAEPTRLTCRHLINAAGLWAPALAAGIDGLDKAHVPQAHFAKGNYFTLAGRAPFSRLIYPVPEGAGLGVHLTLDLGGQARFGPDVEWVPVENATPDYRVDPRRGDVFYAAIRRYWPALKDNALTPAYSGIRPKLQGPDQASGDFIIAGPATHGVPGLVNLFGIESPGLTSSLAIAQAVRDALGQPRA
ncbi:MAG: NAD(P)/FAD-dependent oxidoreductase [Parvibaculum sp.]